MVNKKSESNTIGTGQFLSETQYYRVNRVDSQTITVVNERNFEFNVGKTIVEEGMFTAHQYNQELKVSRTELIEIFSQVGDTVFTVNFNKQPKATDINDAIAEANKGKIIPIAELQKIVKAAYKGEERTLVGYLIGVETGFGRSTVIDLEAEKGSKPDWDGRLRQVDHRTLNWLISKNVKYCVK